MSFDNYQHFHNYLANQATEYIHAICSRAFSVAVCQPQGINHNPFFWILTFQTPLQLKEWLCDQAVVNEM